MHIPKILLSLIAKIVIEKADGTPETFYEPSAKQNLFHLAPEPNVMYGGAAGGGKSHALRMDAYIRCLSADNYVAILLRRTSPELQNTHIERVILEAPKLGAVFEKTANKLRFANGSVLIFGHCEDDAALTKHLSVEYDAIYIDEASTFTLTQFKFLASRARSNKPGITPCVRIATNPGGVGANWIKSYFITREVDRDEDPVYDATKYAFIPATLDDNPHIGPEYEQRLMGLPTEALRQAYRYGNWDVFDGQFFSEWRAKTPDGYGWHVIDELPEIDGRPINEVPWIEVFRSIDWGYRKPGICGWYACLPDGRLIKFLEYVFKETQAEAVAKKILLMSAGMRVRYTVADYQMWMTEGSFGESLEAIFRRNKLPLQQADKDRLNGWMRLHSMLRETTVTPGGLPVPLLQVYQPGCPYTVRTLPTLVADDARPEDIRQKGAEDHAADETRYAVMSRPAPSRRPKVEDEASPWLHRKYTRNQVGYHTQKLLRASRRRRGIRLGNESAR